MVAEKQPPSLPMGEPTSTGGTRSPGPWWPTSDASATSRKPHRRDPERHVVRWLVVRGPCYLSLRAAVEHRWQPDGVILLAEPGRALSSSDVANVLDAPVVGPGARRTGRRPSDRRRPAAEPCAPPDSLQEPRSARPRRPRWVRRTAHGARGPVRPSRRASAGTALAVGPRRLTDDAIRRLRPDVGRSATPPDRAPSDLSDRRLGSPRCPMSEPPPTRVLTHTDYAASA